MPNNTNIEQGQLAMLNLRTWLSVSSLEPNAPRNTLCMLLSTEPETACCSLSGFMLQCLKIYRYDTGETCFVSRANIKSL